MQISSKQSNSEEVREIFKFRNLDYPKVKKEFVLNKISVKTF